jgi:transcriptional antiterminator NusG
MAETMNWYAIRTQNNKERSVLQKLNLELIRSGLTDSMGRSLIPTEKVFSVKNGKKIAREKIIYPGYIFIETNAVGEISNFLKAINGAAGFVKTKSGDITPLKEYEVLKMITDQEETNNITTNTSLFSVGENVKVTEGAFSSFMGKITHVDQEKGRVKVEVMIFSRPTEVELDYLEVERS